MAPPHMRDGRLIEDEKLLMRAMRCLSGLATGSSLHEFARLYEEIAASYLLQVDKLRAQSTEDT